MTNLSPAHAYSIDFYQQCPVVLTSLAWKRLVYRELPDHPGEIGLRLAIIIATAYREVGFSTDKRTFVFGLYHEDSVSDERQWVQLRLTVVTLPSEPVYLHIALLDESSGEGRV